MGTVVDKRRATRWGECGANVTKVGELFFNPLFFLVYAWRFTDVFGLLKNHDVDNIKTRSLITFAMSLSAVVAQAY